MVAFDLGAGGFDQLAVIDPGRTRGHAGHAPEAGIEMADPLRIHVGLALAGEFDQVDSSAR